MKHKWHKEIKAWADGAEIEVLDNDSWRESKFPSWNDDLSYRIKPEPVKVVRYLVVDNAFTLHGERVPLAQLADEFLRGGSIP